MTHLRITLDNNPVSHRPDMEIHTSKHVSLTHYEDGQEWIVVYGLSFADLTALAEVVNARISALKTEAEAILRREEVEARAG